MKNRFKHILQKPFFIVLLPFFYFLHRWSENYSPLLSKEFLSLSLCYSAISIGLTLITFLFYKNFQKAALATFTLISVEFFFIKFFSFFRDNLILHFLSRFSISIPIIFILIILIIYILKKTKKDLSRVSGYLNLLLAVLIIIDGISIFKQSIQDDKRIALTEMNRQLNKCDSCTKPDIYLIVADEYAGEQQLKEYFKYDNSQFYSALSKRDFHIVQNSKSNYNSTIYSMASMFAMTYLNDLGSHPIENYKDMFYCRELVKKNSFTNFLENQEEYNILNYSFFDIGDKKRATQNMFTTERDILSGVTLTNRLEYIFGARLASEKKLLEIKLQEKKENEELEYMLQQAISNTQTNSKPKFVYTHFNMPHWPYYFDSTGIAISPDKFTETFKTDKFAYIQYLKYVNRKLLYLIDQIIQKSLNPPVIILLSDHGFRQISSEENKDIYFMNLNAILLPSKDYSQFKDGMSNVNEFRALLNTIFKQNLTMLKDSTKYIKN